MESLRIVTINTGKCDGRYLERIGWMARELQRLEPDIVACQEAFRSESGTLDTAARLARKLDMHLAWSPARFKERSVEGRLLPGWSGMALLSRTYWRVFETVDLPADPRDGDRVAQICVIPWWDREVIVANLHLSHLRDADDLRREQLQTVLSHPLFGQTDRMRLICGDFNSPREGPILAGLLASEGSMVVRDTFTTGGGTGPRSTLPPQEDGTLRDRCIDFILSVSDDDAHQPLFRSSGVVLNRPDPETGVLPSDHYGVATTLLPLALPRGLVGKMQYDA
jgi:endonuclease/exonuclease/phosphatase family metal-dependent hydrolase